MGSQCCSQRPNKQADGLKPKPKLSSKGGEARDKFAADVPALTSEELSRLSRYERFDKLFPFYRMDIDKYMHHISIGLKIAKHSNPEI